MFNKKLIQLAFIFTFLALFLHKYSFGTGDQAIHIPLILRIINPELFTNDYLFTAGQTNLSYFYQIISFIISFIHLSIQLIFLILYLITSFFLYLGLLNFLNIFVKKKGWHQYFFSCLFVFPIHIAGTAIYTIDINIVPRFIAFTLSIWSLYFLFKQKYLKSIITLLVISFIHPLSFISIFLITSSYILTNKIKISYRFIIIFFVLLSLTNFPIILNILKNEGALSNNWILILRDRNSYAFLDLWDLKEWTNLLFIGFPSFIFLYISKNKQSKGYKFIKSIIIAILIVSLFHFLLTSIFPIPKIISFQLMRILIYLYLSSSISLIIILANLNINFRILSYALTSVLLLYLIILPKKIYLTQNNYWIDVQKWVNKNIGKQCIFLTPFMNQGFRVYSERSIVSEYKDGTLSFYSPVYAQEWKNRESDVIDWEKYDYNQLISLQTKYKFSYIVSYTNKKLNLKEIYNNGEYSIYQMPKISADCN